MRRPLRLIALLAAFAAGLAAAPAGAAEITGAYVYFSPVPHDRLTKGRTVLVVRADGQLPAATRATIRGQRGYLTPISHELGCYLVDVDRFRRDDPGTVGDRVKVTLGKGGALLSRRLPVEQMTAANARGATLGCDADPASTTVLFDLMLQPEVEPDRIFFTANSGPYLKDLTWNGWGTDEAVGTGTYVSDCASCGPKQVLPARYVLSGLRACKGWGARIYARERLEKTLPDGEVDVQRFPGNDTACG